MSQGSVEQFRQNWQREETKYCHWTRGEPVNQIQFAFRQNWLEFAKIMEPIKPWDNKRALEVGAGRGTMSMYFADAGFQCTLLDACEEPLNQAKQAFQENGLSARYVLGDALEIPLADESFDVVFSYGLLEHFEEDALRSALAEQLRVLKPGALWLAYVPIDEPNKYFAGMDAVTETIRLYAGELPPGKSPVFRSGINPSYYGRFFPPECFAGREINGIRQPRLNERCVYPFPMIGPSVDFPFTLNPPHIELEIVERFKKAVDCTGQQYWKVFDERAEPHQAVVLWGWKK